jgi:hypothetical protein
MQERRRTKNSASVLQVIKFNNIAQDRILFEISNFLPK